MKHPITIENYQGSLEELAEDIGNLRYDALESLLMQLANKLDKDSQADFNRNRKRLASKLYHASITITEAAEEIREAWIISAPFMHN